MSKISFFPILILFIAVGIAPVQGGEPTSKASFRVGEEFNYDIRWRFWRLGKVLLGNARVSVVEKLATGADGLYHVRLDIRSNPKFAYLIRFYHTFDSFVDDRMRLPVRYFSHSGKRPDDLKLATRYTFDYPNRVLLCTVRVEDNEYEEKTIPLPDDPVYDGTSLFFHLRDRMRGGGGEERVAIVISGNLVEAELVYLDGREKLGDRDREIETFRINGTADYDTVADLRKGFRLWLSADRDAVLLRAELRIFLGAIVATLQEHKVDGISKIFSF